MNTQIQIKKQNRLMIVGMIIIVSILGYLAFRGQSVRPNSDCLEWGVVKKDTLTQNESWAPTHSDPKTFEDADRMAQELTLQEITGRYSYFVKCKKWKTQ